MRVSALCAVLVGLSVFIVGCERGLTSKRALQVFMDHTAKVRRGPDGLQVGTLDVTVGHIQGYRPLKDDPCDELPSFYQRVRTPERLGILSVVDHGCDHDIALNSPFLEDVPSYEREATKSGEDQYLSLTISANPSFRVEKLVQDGPHATAKLVATLPFTKTGKVLERAGYFPKLDDKDCRYDLPAHGVTCSSDIAFAQVDGKWVVDASNMAK